MVGDEPKHGTQHLDDSSTSHIRDGAAMSVRIRALTALLDDLEAFEFNPFDYDRELDLQSIINRKLSGKINSLRTFCETLGWSGLVARMERITPQDDAVESLEAIQSFVVPEVRELIATTDSEAIPSSVVPRTHHGIVAFVSYSHEDRKCAREVKFLLRETGMKVFLAHDDIETSEEWKNRIIAELKRCDLFVPLLSQNFRASKWAPQEAGFIASRPDVVIAPLSLDDTIPFGFFEHVQSKRLPSQRVSCELLLVPLAKHFPRTILPFLVKWAGEAGSFRCAEAGMRTLVPLFPDLTTEEAQALAEAAVGNNQVWYANLCRAEYLPEFIARHGNNIAPETLRTLEEKTEH